MEIEVITHSKAARMTGVRLPTGLRWYWVSGMQFYPNYGDFKHVWAESDGLSAIIGKQKRPTRERTPEPETIAERAGVTA